MSRPAAPESETPETDAVWEEVWADEFMKSLPDTLYDHARSLERRLSLAQTEIKGHMRIEDELKERAARVADERDFLERNYKRIEAKLAEAQARIAELEKDAARYRWLRSQDWNTGPLFVVKQPTEVRLGTDCPSRDRLDAAIDAALKSRA